jgi:hypothetical protein
MFMTGLFSVTPSDNNQTTGFVKSTLRNPPTSVVSSTNITSDTNFTMTANGSSLEIFSDIPLNGATITLTASRSVNETEIEATVAASQTTSGASQVLKFIYSPQSIIKQQIIRFIPSTNLTISGYTFTPTS